MIANHRSRTLPVLACLAACTVAVDLPAQSRRAQIAAAPKPKAPEPEDDVPALPGDMLFVPGGTFEIGADPEDLLEVEEALNPYSEQARVEDLQALMSELGRRKVTVEPFYLAKHPVTNAEYKAFVDKTGWRFPYHWWKDGQIEHFQASREKINEEVTREGVADKGVEYWRLNWKDLPHAIPAGQEQHPVVFVAWRDAIAYAAWIGMRLPTEPEWVFAATGGADRQFLWGDDPKQITVPRGSRHDQMWEVGHWGEKTAGPFGHEDMVLGVWEWTGDLGFFPFPEDSRDFDRALEKLFKDKLFDDESDRYVASTLSYRPQWDGDKVVAKGGAYFSPASALRVGTRAPIESVQTTSGIGFRVAKSPVPARDLSDSRIKLDYDYSFAGPGRKPNLKDQIGIERYEMSPDGNILGYHAVSIVPFNHATNEKLTKDKLLARTVEDHRPVELATLITTEKLAQPAIEPGIYTLCFRASGMPDELRKALPDAKRAIKAAKDGEVERGEWSKALSKYHITDEEAAGNDAVQFVRLNPGGLKVPTDQHSWLLRDHKGDYVHVFAAAGVIDTKPRYENGDAKLEIEARPDGTERLTVEFGVPVDENARGRVYLSNLRIVIPAEHAGGSKWRLPTLEK